MAAGLGQVITGVPGVALAVMATDCGLSAALSVRVSAAVLLPIVAGANVTATVQVALAARVLVSEKSVLLVPVKAMLLSVTVPEVRLVTVTDWLALVVPTPWLAKVNVAGLREMAAVTVSVAVAKPAVGAAAAKSAV